MAARQRRGAMALAPAAAPESVPAAARAGLDMARPPHGGSRGRGTKHDRPDGPSVHGSRVPEAFPNSKQGTKGRYELSSVRSSSTYPQVSRIAKSEKVGPTAQSGLAVCRASVRALRNVGGM